MNGTTLYDNVGNLDLTELPNGVLSDYVYDDLNRLTGLVHFVDDGTETGKFDASDTLVMKYDYHLRADGKRDQEIETDSASWPALLKLVQML